MIESIPATGISHLLAEISISIILSLIGFLVVHELDESVVTGRNKGTQDGAEPVNPVVAWERSASDGGAEGACGV